MAQGRQTRCREMGNEKGVFGCGAVMGRGENSSMKATLVVCWRGRLSPDLPTFIQRPCLYHIHISSSPPPAYHHHYHLHFFRTRHLKFALLCPNIYPFQSEGIRFPTFQPSSTENNSVWFLF